MFVMALGVLPPVVPMFETYDGDQVDGALVACVGSTTLPSRYEAFLGVHGIPHDMDMVGFADLWLIVAIHNSLVIIRASTPPCCSAPSSRVR